MGTPFKMKGPSMIQGTSGHRSALKAKTSLWDKIKAAGRAVAGNIGRRHGHGSRDSLSHNIAYDYKRYKKEYRAEDRKENIKNK